MTRNTRLRARLVVLAGVSLLLGAQAQATCYNTWGEADANQKPCYAPGADTNAATWCCSRGDTCLSNGLCLSPESNNLMTQQGCTDKAWGGSCTQYCPSSTDRQQTAIPLVPCPNTLDPATNAIKFCCGGPDTTTCCQTSSSDRRTLPTGTILPSTSSSSSSSNSSSDDYSLKIGLGIGLGIGIPILLVLLAVAYLLAQPSLHARKRRRERAAAQAERRKRKAGGGGSGGGGFGDGTNTEKTSDTSHTYPPPRSFGRVDTRTRASSEEGGDRSGGGEGGLGLGMGMGGPGGGGGGAHAWPPLHGMGVVGGSDGGPASASSVATAIAQWARSPFGFGGMEPPPPSPKEMDASGAGGRGRGGWRGTTSRLGAAELPSPDPNVRPSGRESGVRGWKESRHVHVATEVELPTPDTPERDLERGLGGK